MPTFRGKPVKRGGNNIPPTHMKDGSLKYPDGTEKSESVDNYESMPNPSPLPPKKKEEY